MHIERKRPEKQSVSKAKSKLSELSPLCVDIKGAKKNNLKNVHLKIPLYSFTVICGPSGSGKSSLAFETLYAEGQRRYIESLSHYSQQFVKKLSKPEVEDIENIPPSVFVGHKNRVKSSHSVVGTTMEVMESLQQFYEKIGKVLCPKHKISLEKHTPYQGSQKVFQNLKNKRIYILSPLKAKERRWRGRAFRNLLLKEGFLRLYTPPSDSSRDLSRGGLGIFEKVQDQNSIPSKNLYLVIDRLKVTLQDKSRIEDSVSQAYLYASRYNKSSSKEALILSTEGDRLYLNESLSCPHCDYKFSHFDSRLFNFNNPVGACSTCRGFGDILKIDPLKVIPKPELSLAQGALEPFTFPSTRNRAHSLRAFFIEEKINIHQAWKDLPKQQKDLVWEKVLQFFSHLEKKKYKMYVRFFLSQYRSAFSCPTCDGRRLKKEAYQVVLKNKTIDEMFKMSVEELFQHFSTFTFTEWEKKMCKTHFFQMLTRLQFLIHIGLGYLTFDRPTKTLSGGEFQRLSLAKELSKGLSQILYILDEPTIGLHPRDTEKLIDLFEILRERGNTLFIVEHDQDMIQKASYIVEMGPRSGRYGGEVIYSGNRKNFLKCPHSSTAPYLLPSSDSPSVFFQKRPVNMKKHKYILSLIGCSENNLKNIDVSFPLRRLVGVTGVSGSGKSSLIVETLYPLLAHYFKKSSKGPKLKCRHISGLQYLQDVSLVDQSPVGKTLRTFPLSYLKIYSPIRELMASTEQARGSQLTAGHFSINLPKGRCSDCEGLGYKMISMIFMDDIRNVCESCHGKKFTSQVLEIQYKGKNIHDILNLSVEEALDFFVAYPSIRQPLLYLKAVGLGYIQLGQNTQSLSGGENQRLKIAQSLSFNFTSKKDVLYIMDEPTKGLHFREVHLLLKVLHHLVDAGHSVILIEHNLEVLKHSDYIIDVGPESEAKGGYIVAKGSPQELIKQEKKSFTAYHLKKYLSTCKS